MNGELSEERQPRKPWLTTEPELCNCRGIRPGETHTAQFAPKLITKHESSETIRVTPTLINLKAPKLLELTNTNAS